MRNLLERGESERSAKDPAILGKGAASRPASGALTAPSEASEGIGTLSERSLHAALKRWYARPGDRLEVPVGGSIVDLVRGDLLVEFQTRGFSAIRGKLVRLLRGHEVRLVHPIAAEKTIVKTSEDGALLEKRRSPKKGSLDDLFRELVSLADLLAHPRFSLEALLVRIEEVRADDGRGSRRRGGWSVVDRRLVDVQDSVVLASPDDLAALLPAGLPSPFTTRDLADSLGKPRFLAQKMAYCLREAGSIARSGKRGNAILYERPRTGRTTTRPAGGRRAGGR